jgi:hypothetical protein
MGLNFCIGDMLMISKAKNSKGRHFTWSVMYMLDDNDAALLSAYAKANNLTVSQISRKAVKDYLAQALAKQVLEG